MLIRSNIRFKLLFQKYLKGLDTTTTYSVTRYRYIYFYEWSDMLHGVKTFTSETEFFKFLAECKITYTDEQKEFISSNNWCYVTCIPHHHMIIVAKQYYELKDKLDKLKQIPSTYCTSLMLAK